MRLTNYYSKKKVGNKDNFNLKEKHIGVRKVHLNYKSNIAFACNLRRYINDNWNMSDFARDNTVLQNDGGKWCQNDEPLKVSEWYFILAIKQRKKE